MMIGTEVMIAAGGHQFCHGRLVGEDTTTFTIPFTSVQLRAGGGKLFKTKFALVPSKYIVAFDVDKLRADELAAAAEKYGTDSSLYKRVVRAVERSLEVPE
ncbi:MAG: hypothetical protein V4631_21055 [Pseudomonadota bacterium]